MKITRNKREMNKFSIEGLSAGKLMAIHSALEAAKLTGKLGIVGEDVLQLFNQQRSIFIG